ncbi:MAG TPA: SoxR reducing system RseC family protein [Mucilaginibacter sp.]|nr:SoxR reducing system RseC family protein [Mucilaginibacter sp.]
MKSRFLFPNRLKPFGWLLAIPGFVLGYFSLYRDYKIPGFSFQVLPSQFYHHPVSQDLTKTLALLLIIIGLFFIAFSKEKREDELTVRMRQNALYWSVLISYLIYFIWLIVSIVIELLKLDKDPLSGLADVLGMSIYNLFTPFLIFIARYYYLRYSKNGEYQVGRMYYLPEKPYKMVGQFISVPLLLIIIFSFTGSLFFKGDLELKDWAGTLMLLLPIALLIWGYSKRNEEDEFISTLRLESMQLAVYFNYAVLLVANFFFYFLDFMLVMFLNLGTIALFFVLRFSYVLWKSNPNKHVKGILAL